ncbi:MAG: hypothetical protein FWD17_12910 [Polyangiaceae bacterium]|nr:hypothetical protein [Polyangiaceae bacterium]
MTVLAAAGGVLLLCGDAAAQYPACESQANNSGGTCVMSNSGNHDVMVGDLNDGLSEGYAVPVYVLAYGSWTSAHSQYVWTVVENLIDSMDNSVYASVVKTYTGANGPTGMLRWAGVASDSGSLGTNPSQSQVESLMLSKFSNDSNALYLFLTDTGYFLNSVGSCGGLNWAGSGIHLAYVHNFFNTDCPTYNWAAVESKTSYLTPNNDNGADTTGAVDLTADYVMHELMEQSTDPNWSTNGWFSSGTGGNTQIADFCQATPTYPSSLGPYTYQVSTPAGSATANFHGAYGDFLLQMMRVNAGVSNWTSTEGYCATTYGGPFWGMNFGFMWSPIGDWAYGSYKGECEPGQPVIGLSQYTSGNFNPHAVMCGTSSDGQKFPQGSGCQGVSIASGATTWCPSGDYVAGVAQSQSGVPDALLCCPGNGTNGFYCWYQGFSSANMANSWTPYDWDYGYWKAECSAGNFAGGVATNSSDQLTALVCCGPVNGG